MAWTLQPRSYMQAIRPNLYNLAYRRTGSYKGMGWLGQTDYNSFPGTTATYPGSPVGQITQGPYYVCPDGSQVMASSDCPAGVAVTASDMAAVTIDQTGINQMIETPLTAAQIAAMSTRNAAFFGSQAGVGPNPPAPSALTKWMPFILAGIFMVLVFSSERRR